MSVELAGRGHAGALRAVEQTMKACTEGRDNLFLVVAGSDSGLGGAMLLQAPQVP